MDDWKLLTLRDFKNWLENLSEDAVPDAEARTNDGDWHALFAEFASLRQEVRLQNREQAKVVRDLGKLAEVGQGSIDLLRGHTEELSGLEERIRQAAERRCLLPFLDVRDALVRGADAAAKVASGRSLFRRPPSGIQGVIQGYGMAVDRFDRAMALAGVQIIQTVGLRFNSGYMRAVETRLVAKVAEGVVLEEFLSGFVRGDEVLRPAEVAVNRHQDVNVGG